MNDLQRILNMQKCTVTLPDLNFAAIKKPLSQTHQVGPDRNAAYRELISALKQIDHTITTKPNLLVAQREADEAAGNFGKLEQNVVKL